MKLGIGIGLNNRIKRFIAFLRERKKLSVFVLALGGSLGLIPVMALGGNQLIEVVDSSAFCVSCHNVHEAQAITYQLSPHNKVSCATCHVGEGVDNLVMSKLNGLKDILPTITGSYEKPIQTPLQDRRPSNETCETCHWSEKFFGDIPRIKTTYATDQANTANTTTLVLNVDGGKAAVASGIHWHSTAKVWYLALDDQRLQIAWLATENSTGGINEYVDPDRIGQVTPEMIQQNKRLMDCVDCHNRVTHLYSSPNDLIDKALTDGGIDVNLPFIKAKALEALVPQNASIDEAYAKIATIPDFYKNSYPQIFQAKQVAIDNAVTRLDEIARQTTFKDGLDWNTHLNQAVHAKPDDNMQIDWLTLSVVDDSAGCFRCHGNLVKADDPANPGLKTVLNGLNLSALKISADATVAANVDNFKYGMISANDTGVNALGINPVSSNTTQGGNSANTTSDNRTGSVKVPVDNDPHDGRLNDNCNLCHSTSKSPFDSPLAPATPHPIDGLDDCLVCHNQTSAKPFKTDHPWATNDACASCHKAAPKLNPVPLSGPPEKAKQVPHASKGLEDCLVCHDPAGTQPIKDVHPWATNETCTACHTPALVLKPLPLSVAPVTPDIAHTVKGFEDCLSCHGQPTLMPFSTDHPWSTNANCSTCHKPSNTPLSATHLDTFARCPAISHAITGLSECAACHRPTVSHPWASTQLCTKCHQNLSGGGGGGGAGGVGTPAPSTQLVMGANIPHSTTGLENCIACHSTGTTILFPADHFGRPNSMCLICHQLASAAAIPEPPSVVAAVAASAGQVTITWVDNSATETGFRVDRATSADFLTNLISVEVAANSVNYTDTTTAGSTVYYYRVIAHNTAGDSIASTVSVTTPVSTATIPAAPTGLTASPISDSEVHLNWADNSNNETGFRIDRATTSNFLTNLITVNTAINSVSFSDTSVSANTTYFYRVYSFNSAGNSAASNTASATTPIATINPAALYSANCAMCHGASLQGGSASALTTSALSGVTLAQVTAVIANGIGTMPAYSSSMNSAQIAALAQWLKGSPPSAPANLTASAISAGQVNLSWLDNSADEAGFRIERATSSNFQTNLLTATVAANTLSYSNTNTAGSTTYYYRVYAYNASGDSAASNTVTVTTPASTVALPAAPTSLTAGAISATQVNLAWLDNSSTETGFRVDRATTSNFATNLVTINTAGNATGYSDTTAAASTIYYYRVYAINSAGNSAASNTASVTTPALSPAQNYAAVCAVCHGANQQGGSASALTPASLAGRTLAQVTATITNGIGTMPGYSSSFSSSEIAALAQWLKGPPPAAPTNLTAGVISAGQVNLSWLDNSTDETGLRLERATTSNFLTNLVTTSLAASTVSYNDMTTAGSTTYYYRVFAFNSTGDSAASNTATAVTPAPTVTAPAAPTSLTASVISAGQVNLAWLDNSSTETGFRVDRATTSNFATNLVTVNTAANATAYSDTTVSETTTYYYRAYAFNSAGNSGASNTASATTPVAPIDPAALYSANCAVCHGNNRQGGSASALTTSALSGVTLSQVTAFINNGIGSMPGYSSSMNSAQIAALALWLKGPPPAAPSNLTATPVSAGQVNLAWLDNATDETNFRVERATNGSFTTGLVTATIAANVVNFNDTTTAGSTTYYYRVFAFNSTGDSSASNTATAVTPAPTVTAPAAPTSLTASAISATQVNLAWLDNSSTETGFRVDRATTSNFATNLVTVNTAANATAYSDTTVSETTTYYYRVYAFNSAGNSAASNTATITTPVAPIDPAALYSANCAVCHGNNRQGGSASALTTSALSGVTLAQVTAFINNGIGSMPGYSSSMNSAEIAALALWLKGPPPSAPTSLTATPVSAGQVNLSWLDNSTDETGLRLERATTSNFLTNLVTTTLAANTVSYNDMTTAGSTTYYYRVFAFNSTGDSAASNTATAVTPAPTVTAPAAPTSLTAGAVSTTQVNLAWLDNSTTETGFRIDRATTSNFATNLVTVNAAANAVSYNDLTTAGSTTYYYRIYAFNSAGNSAASNTATITTPVPAIDPAALYSANCAVCHGNNRQGGSASALTTSALSGVTLSQVTAFINNGIGSMPGYSSSMSSAEIAALAQWLKGPPPAAPTSLAAVVISAGQVNLTWLDNATNETNFRVERATNGSFTTGLVTTTVAANAVGYNDTATAGSTGYYYRVFAYSSSGDSASSNVVAVTTPASTVAAPAAPSGLTASVVSATQVNLAWLDNSSTETGFLVQRATNNLFTVNLVTATVTANIRAYNDITVSPSTTYYFRVIATNSGGNSAASNTVSAVTPALAVAPPIAHTTTGYTTCLACHATNLGIQPVPASHAGRTDGTCTTCHQTSGDTTAPVLSVGAPRMGHTLTASRQNCLSCHDVPNDHNNRTNITCPVCHRPGN